MPDHHTPARRNQPLPLLRNTTYPTYQLYAVAGLGKTPPEQVLAITILETLSWLRSRFRELEVPQELVWPGASDYESFDLKSLRSFRIDTGYRVEVVWLPDERIWALQLTEPDLGSQPGEAVQERSPVPGRLFETNVAFRIVSGQVECGFRTIVSDPIGTTAPCEVYRLAMIKRLARNPLVGLEQGWPIIDTAHSLERVADVNHLQEWLKDRERMMLAVIVAESVSDRPVTPPTQVLSQHPARPTMPTLEDLKSSLISRSPFGFTSSAPVELPSSGEIPSLKKHVEAKLRGPSINQTPSAMSDLEKRRSSPASSSSSLFSSTSSNSPPSSPLSVSGNGTAHSEVAKEPAGQWLVDIEQFAHDKMGYAQIFTLPMVRVPDFTRITGRTIAPGDVLLIEPLAFGGEAERIPRRRLLTDPESEWRRLDERIQNAPKNKPMAFGAVKFLPAAKEIEQTNQIRRHLSTREILRASDERAKAAEQRQQAELQGMREQQQLLEDRIGRLWEQIELADEEKAQLRATVSEVEAEMERRLEEKDREIARLKALRDRPRDLTGVVPWAERYLGEGLFFHQRAKKELESVAPGEVDLSLLCDALEYLATDYRDELLGLIDEDECRNRASKKYNRGFDVKKLTGISIEMYPTDYKIKYYKGHLGKPIDSVLDLHLRVGHTNENLLRIYFLYDKELKRLVIGSLPRHLSTVSYK